MKRGPLLGVGRTRDRAERQDLNTRAHLVLPRLLTLESPRGSRVIKEKWKLGHMHKIRVAKWQG